MRGQLLDRLLARRFRQVRVQPRERRAQVADEHHLALRSRGPACPSARRSRRCRRRRSPSRAVSRRWSANVCWTSRSSLLMSVIMAMRPASPFPQLLLQRLPHQVPSRRADSSSDAKPRLPRPHSADHARHVPADAPRIADLGKCHVEHQNQRAWPAVSHQRSSSQPCTPHTASGNPRSHTDRRANTWVRNAINSARIGPGREVWMAFDDVP